MRDQATFQVSPESAPSRAENRVTQPRFWDALPARWTVTATTRSCAARFVRKRTT